MNLESCELRKVFQKHNEIRRKRIMSQSKTYSLNTSLGRRQINPSLNLDCQSNWSWGRRRECWCDQVFEEFQDLQDNRMERFFLTFNAIKSRMAFCMQLPRVTGIHPCLFFAVFLLLLWKLSVIEQPSLRAPWLQSVFGASHFVIPINKKLQKFLPSCSCWLQTFNYKEKQRIFSWLQVI